MATSDMYCDTDHTLSAKYSCVVFGDLNIALKCSTDDV